MGKLEKLRKALQGNGIDGILITSPYNRRYVSNFTGTAGVVLITEDKALFITDFRYIEQASKQAVGFTIVQHKGLIHEEIASQVKNLGIRRLGFEQDYMTYSSFQTYEKAIQAELVPVSNLIENLRLIKTESEIKILKEAADIADAAFKHIIDYIKPVRKSFTEIILYFLLIYMTNSTV